MFIAFPIYWILYCFPLNFTLVFWAFKLLLMIVVIDNSTKNILNGNKKILLRTFGTSLWQTYFFENWSIFFVFHLYLNMYTKSLLLDVFLYLFKISLFKNRNLQSLFVFNTIINNPKHLESLNLFQYYN